MTMKPDLHVVFGAGPVGAALVEELNDRRLRVRAISRSGTFPQHDGVETMSGDASDVAFATRAAEGAAAVYQVMNPPYDQWPELFPALQAGVVAAARASESRYVSFENLYAYGDTRGALITEELPLRPDTRKGHVRSQMAEDLARLSNRGDLVVATARSSDYLGPRATWQSPMGERVIGRALMGKSAQVIGDPSKRHSYTYVRDAARVLATLGTDDRADGEVFIVPNAPAVTTTELVGMIGEELGQEIKVSVAPTLVLRLMGLFDSNVREILEMTYEFEQDFLVDGSKFTRVFGMKATPLAQSVAETVAWWRSTTGQV